MGSELFFSFFDASLNPGSTSVGALELAAAASAPSAATPHRLRFVVFVSAGAALADAALATAMAAGSPDNLAAMALARARASSAADMEKEGYGGTRHLTLNGNE